MRLLCVQCLKVNDVSDDVGTDASGKVRVECPGCGFVTVITRRAPGDKGPPPRAAPPPRDPPARQPEASDQPGENLSYDGLFSDGGAEAVGDWMVRHLDGTEVGPLGFEKIREMIATGQLGKIDEVRKMDERYVPAAFHEATAELFNELETTGI